MGTTVRMAVAAALMTSSKVAAPGLPQSSPASAISDAARVSPSSARAGAASGTRAAVPSTAVMDSAPTSGVKRVKRMEMFFRVERRGTAAQTHGKNWSSDQFGCLCNTALMTQLSALS